MIIDVGALIFHHKNEKIAARWIELVSPQIAEVVVYFDSSDKLVVYNIDYVGLHIPEHKYSNIRVSIRAIHYRRNLDMSDNSFDSLIVTMYIKWSRDQQVPSDRNYREPTNRLFLYFK